jgi:plastocyanin
MRKFVLSLALAGAVLPLAACSSSSSGSSSGAPATATPTMTMTMTTTTSSATAPAAADSITISNFAFAPKSITVAPGAKVSVTNKDSTTHTLTSTDSPAAFDTGDIAPGKTVTFTAPSKAGSYAYICQIHQYMQGTLIVS